ncbi:MAG: LPS export ABC transporter permease LptG [Gemmatimonadota bacterium]|nr:LPS export ABC transporter permease LptG [Gemmatimonadota bacterium]
MTILDRYIVRTFLAPLGGSALVFLTVAIVVDLFERLDTFIDHEIPPATILEYYAATMPYIFLLTLPIATLIGILFSLGGMARRNELIAMTTSGISLYRILLPVLLTGLLVSAGGFLFTSELVPRGNRTSHEIYNHVIKGRPRVQGTSRSDLNFLGEDGRFFLIGRFDGLKGHMSDVVVQQFSEGTLVRRIDAETADYGDDGWVFRNGYIRTFHEAGIDARAFLNQSIPEIRETPSDFLKTRKAPDEMTLSELTEHTRRTALSGGDVRRLRVDRLMRFSFPFSCFVIVLLGAPLTSAIRRGGHALGFGIALLVGFLYYILLEIGKTFGYNGTLPPTLAAWLPNLVFTAGGAVGLWRTRK